MIREQTYESTIIPGPYFFYMTEMMNDYSKQGASREGKRIRAQSRLNKEKSQG